MEIRQLNLARPLQGHESANDPIECAVVFACDLYELLCPTRDSELRDAIKNNLRTEAGTVTVPAAFNTLYHNSVICREGALNLLRALHALNDWRGTEPMLVGALRGDPPKGQKITSPEVPSRRAIALRTIGNALRPSEEPFLPIKQRRAVGLMLCRVYGDLAFQDGTKDYRFQETLARGGDLLKPRLFDMLNESYNEQRIAARVLGAIGTDSMGTRRRLKQALRNEKRTVLRRELQEAICALNTDEVRKGRLFTSPSPRPSSDDV